MLKTGDCLELMREMPDDSVDLVFTSPPYEAARTYGIGFNLKGQEWVDWAVERYVECCRVSRGLVAWVVEGQTKQFRWSATPALLMADLHRQGVKLRKPPAFHRVGIPGSGGPDWLRNDYEFIVCASGGKLPWSDNVAMGHPPKHQVGGAMSNRTADGRRRNAKTGIRLKDGRYSMPDKANPGNVINCHGGGGHMGSKLAHENEAPFPEKLAEFFVKSFCPPDGTVLDPFCGSGTTLKVAIKNGRQAIGYDIRESQTELSGERVRTECA
jgi:DNA modification methylase